MAILWAGGEDLDFQNGALPVNVNTASSHIRTGYARCTVGGQNMLAKGTTFTPVTSCWLSGQLYTNWAWSNAPCFGLGKSGTNSALMVGVGGNGRVAILKRDNGTNTVLAESATIGPTLALHRCDMQLISYGASATVNVYWDGSPSPVVTYTGSVAASGVTNLDQVWLNGDGSHYITEASEIFVADEDTRLLGVVTLAPGAAGTTMQWSGAYTDISETTLNDSTVNFTNITAQDQQVNLTDLPAGTFVIRNLFLAARASVPTGSTATQVALGIRSAATIDAGTLQAATAAWGTLSRQLGPNDPATSAPWTVAAINALQLNLRSG